MSSAVQPQGRRYFAPALLCGLWAGAIAAAPSLTMKAVLAAPAILLPLVWWSLHKPARWLSLFFFSALLLPPLPIPIGDSGPHPCLLFAALGLFAGLIWLSDWRIELTPVSTGLIALFGVLLASVGLAAIDSGLIAAAGSLARVALFGISVYVFFYAAYGPGKESDSGVATLYWLGAASALFACIDFYYQFPAPAGYGPQFVWLDSGVYRRAQGIFYEASTLGNFCAFFLVMIAVAFTRPRADNAGLAQGLVGRRRSVLRRAGALLFARLSDQCGGGAGGAGLAQSPAGEARQTGGHTGHSGGGAAAFCDVERYFRNSPRCTGYAGSRFRRSICSRPLRASARDASRVGRRWSRGSRSTRGRRSSVSATRPCRIRTSWALPSW